MEYKNGMGRRIQVRKIKDSFKFPTLFSKLFTLYISIVIGMMIFFFVIFSGAFENYFVGYTQQMMIRQAKMIEKEYSNLGQFEKTTSQAAEQILYKIQILDSYLDATTWIVDRNNSLLVTSNYNNHGSINKKLPNDGILDKALESIFAGNTIRIESGMEEYFYTPVLTIGHPIRIFDEVEYALFIHTPMPQVLETLTEVKEIILKVIGLASILVFIGIYFVSRQMTKPLKEMNRIAKDVANGEFDKRIVLGGEDEIAELAKSFNYMAGELNKIEEGRKSFIANVSHDMRSPLTSIQGFITAILDGTIPPEKHEKYLHIVLNESQRMIKMANDILELNKMEEGRLPLRKAHFNVHEMIKDVLTNFEGIIKEKKIKVNLVLDLEEQIVFADPEKIVRVIQNLLDNAFKFVNTQGQIEIETAAVSENLWVYIRNTGPVITEEEQKNIWERFYKADSSRGKDKKGMGIGLVIVKEIIKQHAQTLGVVSSKEQMTTFYFTLERATTNRRK